MLLIDVNVLVYSFRRDAPGHVAYLRWLKRTVASDAAFGVSDLVLSGVLRILTHPRIFSSPERVGDALAFVQAVRDQPNCLTITPGRRHWGIFTRLCRASGAKGNLVPDAYHAALAIEFGGEWVTTDRDYSRFPGLRWRHPLEGEA